MNTHHVLSPEGLIKPVEEITPQDIAPFRTPDAVGRLEGAFVSYIFPTRRAYAALLAPPEVSHIDILHRLMEYLDIHISEIRDHIGGGVFETLMHAESANGMRSIYDTNVSYDAPDIARQHGADMPKGHVAQRGMEDAVHFAVAQLAERARASVGDAQ